MTLEELLTRVKNGEIAFNQAFLNRLEELMEMKVISYYFNPKTREFDVNMIKIEIPPTITVEIH